MENKICCGFGHRKIWTMVPDFTDILENLIQTQNISTFLTGGMGDFDAAFSACVLKLKTKYPNIHLILVKPYFSQELNKNKSYYNEIYDEVVIPELAETSHPKSAITKRNRWMVEQSDVIVAYVCKDYGGAFSALKYAKKLGKKRYLL